MAATLYHCLGQLEDGLDEMERFTYSYEESYNPHRAGAVSHFSAAAAGSEGSG